MNFLPPTPQRAFRLAAHCQVKGKASAGTVKFHTVIGNHMYPAQHQKEAA